MQEKPRVPFFGPETAVEEIRQRVQVLRKRAADEREEAENYTRTAAGLREDADRREHIARQYEGLLGN